MTTENILPTSFTLGAREGRTGQPLHIHGVEMLLKLSNEDTDGRVAIFYQNCLPMTGPPVHRHSREDEWFYVLEGEITMQIDGQRTVLRAGDSAFALRGTAHTFQNFGPAPAQMLAIITPGRLQQFFKDLSLLNRDQSAPDLVRVEQLMNNYGAELLGPPLS